MSYFSRTDILYFSKHYILEFTKKNSFLKLHILPNISIRIRNEMSKNPKKKKFNSRNWIWKARIFEWIVAPLYHRQTASFHAKILWVTVKYRIEEQPRRICLAVDRRSKKGRK